MSANSSSQVPRCKVGNSNCLQNDQITVLCLHGNRQNAAIMKRLCEPLIRKGKHANVRFVFINSLYPLCEEGGVSIADIDPHSDGKEEMGRQWWPRYLSLYEIGRAEFTPEFEEQAQETFDQLDRAIAETGATCLLGFSQGANVAATYMEWRGNEQIKSVVACCGYSFAPYDGEEEEKGNGEKKRTMVPCALMNVVSEKDETVPPKYAPQNFRMVEWLRHDKGHRMVTRAADAIQIIEFILNANRMY